MYQEGTQATQAHSIRSVHNEHATQYTVSERSSQSYNSPHYRMCLTQNVAAYGYVYMCKDGYTVMAARPLLAAGYLFLDQLGFISGTGSWLGFVLVFGEHDTVNPGFSVCANKI